MQCWVRKTKKGKIQLVKSEGRAKNKRVVGVGTVSKKKSDRFIHLNLPRFYYYLRGGGIFLISRAWRDAMGSSDFFYPLYLYEKCKKEKK